MSREYRFRQVDVFTDRPLSGNPLAVFLDPGDLDADEMQAIAREMNLSETTFVLPTERPECAARVRIFTPRREIPFAGHPTIGTAFVLAIEKRVAAESGLLALEEGIGAVDVVLEGDVHAPAFVWMRHRPASFGAEVEDRPAMAAALGLTPDDLRPRAPVQPVSTGSSFLFVPVRDRETVDRATLDVGRLSQIPDASRLGVFVFAADPDPAAGRVYSRMFAPHTSGVPEDPASGSASGPLGAYLVRHRLLEAAGDVHIVSEQGTRMGRQSFVHIKGRTRDGDLHDIMIGGGVVPVLDGILRLPVARRGASGRAAI